MATESARGSPPNMPRRVLGALAALALALHALVATAQTIDGPALPGLQVFDEAMRGLINRWEVPGASLSLAKDGRLLLSRGYGLASVSGDSQ